MFVMFFAFRHISSFATFPQTIFLCERLSRNHEVLVTQIATQRHFIYKTALPKLHRSRQGVSMKTYINGAENQNEVTVDMKMVCEANASSHTPPEDRQACLSGAERGYHGAKRSYLVTSTKKSSGDFNSRCFFR